MLRQFTHLPRFFSTAKPSIALPLQEQPDRKHIEALTQYQQVSFAIVKQQYPTLLQREFSGEIAYTLSAISPAQMVAMGGLKSKQAFMMSSRGYNSGSICFSLLPEVTSVFWRTERAYLYAFPLVGTFLLPGTRWREIISPGAFPLPDSRAWFARELIDIKQNNRIVLGPVMGFSQARQLPCQGERLADYLAGNLFKPQELSYGDDSESEFVIVDTSASAAFQKEVEAHYQQHNRSSLSKI